jgi:hypothetical protein
LIWPVSITLLVLPWFSFGPNNDLVMRASIPALFILAMLFADTLVRLPWRRVAWVVGIAIAVLGAATPASEILRGVVIPSYRMSACNFADAQAAFDPSDFHTNYLARIDAIPAWLHAPPSRTPIKLTGAKCWPDYPFSPPTVFPADHSLPEMVELERRR